MKGNEAPAAPAETNAAPGAETLDDLAREAQAEAPETPAGEAEVIPPQAPNDGLVFGCNALVTVIGGLVCSRAGVAPLSSAEVEAVGKALAGVAVYYMPADGDPRFMAWMTLALAIGSVAAPRVREARERDAAKPDGA